MDVHDGKWLAETLRVLQQLDAWAARTGADGPGLRPAPRSPLCGDDNQAHPYQLSHAAWHFLSGAVDHLGCLRTLLCEAKVVHMYAPFTLIRAGLENACGAVWLLQPAKRKERLARRLLLAIDDVRQREQARQLVCQPGPRPMQVCLDEIRDIGKRANLDDAALKGKAMYTEIVKSVDQSGQGQAGRGELESVQCLRPWRPVGHPGRVTAYADAQRGPARNRDPQD